MSAFHTAVQDYVEAVRGESQHELATRANAVLDAAGQADERAASWALMAFVDILADPECPFHAMTACLCEPLMRQGGDPWLAVGLMIERFADTLQVAIQFREELEYRCRPSGADPLEEMRERGPIWKALAREQPHNAHAANSLELFCLPLPPIVSHFPQVRQLLRADPATLDNAIRLAREVEGLDEIIRIIEQHAAEQMAPRTEPVEDALSQLRQAIARGVEGRREVSAALMALYRALFSVDLATRNLALRGLAEEVPAADAGCLGEIGQFMGSIVETGGDPLLGIGALMGRLPKVLDQAGLFLTACLQGAPKDDSIADVVQRRAPEVVQHLSREARAFESLPALCLGVIALLSRSLEARKQYCGNTALIEKASALANAAGTANFLWKMLQVLDGETLTVVEPELQRGWKVKIQGIADNFQLHTLLAGALIGPREDGWIPGLVGVTRDGEPETPIPGRPLDERAAGLARFLPCTPKDLTVWSQVQLWTWHALQADGSLPDNPLSVPQNHLIWNEGVPADIPAFEGSRIVLMSSVPMTRSWSAGRIFHGMHGDLTIEEAMDRDALTSLLHRLSIAPR